MKHYYKRIHFIIIIIFFFVFSASCQEKVDKEEKVYEYLSGVWYHSPNPQRTVERVFSWGKGQVVINRSIEIDLGAETLQLFILVGLEAHLTASQQTSLPII